MSTTPSGAEAQHHHSRPMGGRDRHESHRVATPLELLFDLTFVIGFASFGICWAWTNLSWFASAYDTDHWIFRRVTMVQKQACLGFAQIITAM